MQATDEIACAFSVSLSLQGFNTATSSFSHVLSNFSESQKLVRKLQETLNESKRLLQSRNQNLKDYYFQNRMAAKMKEILEKIQYVVEIPSWLDHYMAEKQYVHAVVLLQHTLAMLVSEDLVEVDGLLELREEILVRKHFVQQFLVEELHRIIYGKEADVNAHMRFVNQNAANATRQQYAPQENNLRFNADGTRVKPNLADPSAAAASLAAAAAASNRSPTPAATAAPRPTPADSKYSPFYVPSSAFDSFELGADMASSNARERERASSAPNPALQSLLNDETQESYLKNPSGNANKFLQLVRETNSQEITRRTARQRLQF